MLPCGEMVKGTSQSLTSLLRELLTSTGSFAGAHVSCMQSLGGIYRDSLVSAESVSPAM
jgi:hypothetical protein